jgi:hypothetical protein
MNVIHHWCKLGKVSIDKYYKKKLKITPVVNGGWNDKKNNLGL